MEDHGSPLKGERRNRTGGQTDAASENKLHPQTTRSTPDLQRIDRLSAATRRSDVAAAKAVLSVVLGQAELPEPAFRAGSVGGTAQEAARRVKPIARAQAALVYDAVVRLGKATPEEVTADLLDREHRVILNSVRARICGLSRIGLLLDSGERGLGESRRIPTIRWRPLSADELSHWHAVQALKAEKEAGDE